MQPLLERRSRSVKHLFLGSSTLVLLGLGPLLPHTDQTSLAASIAELPVRGRLALEVRNLALLDLELVGDRERAVRALDLALVSALAMLLHVVGRCLAVLWRLDLAREEHETGLVGLEALDVGGEGLFGEVLAARVDANSDGGSQLAWDLGGLLPISMLSVFDILIAYVPSARRGRIHDRRAHGDCT